MKIRGNRAGITIILLAVLLLVSCSFTRYAASGDLIINASDVKARLDKGYVLVDAQKTTSFLKEHVENAVNIERNQIIVSDPVPNSLAPASMIEEAAGKAGLTENSDLVIYDDNMNMDASRLFWTLKIWGHKGDITIVSGGLTAMKREGYAITAGESTAAPAVYKAGTLNGDMLATKEDILQWINNPADNYVLIDVRTDEEYNGGTIPGSIHINHERNMFVNEDKGTTFRPVSHIRILYKELGITPDKTIVMYCKSSVRAANTYAALYDAGYRNLKIYDGAWLEWSALNLPVYKTVVEVKTTTSQSDNS